MDKIARVRQEIERRYKEFDGKTGDIATASRLAYLDVISFLDTLSEEPNTPEFPETFEICLYDGRTPDNEKYTECSTTCSVRKEEPDKSLEEAAEEYIEKGRYLPEAFFVRPAFIAGAEWQASQMPMPEDTVLFNKGVAEGRRLEREDIMKDVVEGLICATITGTNAISFFSPLPKELTAGDKVRIVVCKKEDE